MHVGPGLSQNLYGRESAARYVFARLLRDGRHTELLSLPDAFNRDLHAWLLQQVRLQRAVEHAHALYFA